LRQAKIFRWRIRSHRNFWNLESEIWVAAAGRAVAPVPKFFLSCGEFLRPSLGPGWPELPIVDCRFSIAYFGLLMDIGRSCHATFSIVNRQSAIDNENLVFGLRLRAAL
jgi:hypothetical protein